MTDPGLATFATAEHHEELGAWFEEWASYVASIDFEAARQLFHPEAIGFGTYMDYVRGLNELEQRQWRSIWTTIENFHFLTERLICGVSSDGIQAWGIVPWSSKGFHQDGSSFERPGRATVLFTRASVKDPWRAIHTHISLAPGTPQTSHGTRQPKS